MGVSLIFITSCAISHHFFLLVEINMPKISRLTKEETEQLIELVCENITLYDQSCSDYSNACRFLCCLYKRKSSNTSSLPKQASNSGLEWTGTMTDRGRKKDGNARPSVYKYNQKRMQFRMLLMCQSCAHTKFLPAAVPHAVSISVQMDSCL